RSSCYHRWRHDATRIRALEGTRDSAAGLGYRSGRDAERHSAMRMARRNVPMTPPTTLADTAVDPANLWRLDTPGHAGWPRTARPGDPRKYFMVSADCHANEPADLWATRIDARYRERVPRVITDANGVKWRVSEGHRPDRLRTDALEGEDRARQLAGA